MNTFPAPHFVDSAGVRLAVYEAGPRESAAPPIVLVHGFPEIAYSWRKVMAGLAARGFRVLAPDMRGYGASDCPSAVEAYDMAALTVDLVALLDAHAIEKAVFVGHDWGGLVTWQMPLRHPTRVAGCVGLNTPFTKRPPRDPIEIYRERFGEHFYIVRFNVDDEADRVLAADPERAMRFYMRRPEETPRAGHAGVDMFDALAAYDPAADDRQLLSEADLAVYVEAFTRTGFTPGINWYRNFTRNWRLAPDAPDHVPHPSLMICAGRDPFLPPEASIGMEKYVPNLERALIPQSGHWTQQEAPEEVTALIAAWVTRTFSPP